MKTQKSISLLCLFLAVLALMSLSTQVVKASDDIRVLNTGVGVEQRQSEADYSTKLVFSEKRGPLLADIHFIITDAQSKKKILEMSSAGPWVFADLPSGKYNIKATRKNGSMQSAQFNVTGKRQTKIVLSWK